MISMELNTLKNELIDEYVNDYSSNMTLREFLNSKGLFDNYVLPIIKKANYKQVYSTVLKGTRVAVKDKSSIKFIDDITNVDISDYLYIVQ